MNQVPLSELERRMTAFRTRMDARCPDWRLAVIISKINQYYLTGTMQEGVLLIPREDEAVLWVRKSYERAVEESLFPHIAPMDSFREIAATREAWPETVYLETEFVPLAYYQRFQKYFRTSAVKPLDAVLGDVRARKSDYELERMRRSGAIHRHVLEDRVPAMLREGMSEADLMVGIYHALMEEGHQGVIRFAMFDIEGGMGQLGFGVNSLYPTSFNGPGGARGLDAAIPSVSSREFHLEKGQLVFVDTACGVEGYHTDKTSVYMFGRSLPDEVIAIHEQCVDIQNKIAEQLRPGAIPADIYRSVLSGMDSTFQENFMGFGRRRVKFLGHGIGLQVDERPVLAEGFDEPLEEGMVLAVEPKKGIANIGMVGIENTFIVTPTGGECITGMEHGLIKVF